MLFEDFEFLFSLVSLPVAMTRPMILLWDILQPAHIVFSSVTGSALLFYEFSK